MSNAIANSSIDWDQEFEAYLKENKTLAYMMLKSAEKFADLDALTYKVKDEWVSITWKDFGEQVRAVAKALLEMDLLQPGEMAGIFSANRAEWAIADLGILAIRSVSVPIYATNSAEEAAHIVNDAGIKIMFVGEQEQYDRAKKVKAECSCLEKSWLLTGTLSSPGMTVCILTKCWIWAARLTRMLLCRSGSTR